MTDPQELLNTGVAAEHLASLNAGRNVAQWALWLQNNRNPARRAAYRVPYVKLGGGVFYDRDELDRFAEFERGRQLGAIKLTGRAAEVVKAMGIGTVGGSTTGRRMTVTGVLGQIDEVTRQPFVQFITAEPFMVYRLDLQQAGDIAKGLLQAVQDAKTEASRHV